MVFRSVAQRKAVFAALGRSKALRIGRKVAIGTGLAGAGVVAAAPREEAGDWRVGARYALGTAGLGYASGTLKRHAFTRLLPGWKQASREYRHAAKRYELAVKGGLGIPGGQRLSALAPAAPLRTFARDVAAKAHAHREFTRAAAASALKWKGYTALGAAALPVAGAVHLGVRHYRYKKRQRQHEASRGLR